MSLVSSAIARIFWECVMVSKSKRFLAAVRKLRRAGIGKDDLDVLVWVVDDLNDRRKWPSIVHDQYGVRV